MNIFGRGMMVNIPPVVKNLLIINVAMFVLTFLAQTFYNVDLNRLLGLYYISSEHFMPYQVVTHMFMHGGLMHIFFNMYALYMFGNILENTWGGKRFLIFYLVTGLGAAFLHMLVNYIHFRSLASGISPEMLEMVKDKGFDILMSNKNYSDANLGQLNLMLNVPTIGASGAVFGLLIAFGMLFPNIELRLIFPPVSIKAKYFVIAYGVLELFLGLSQPDSNIAHFAHLGGMLFGFILVKYWQKNQFNNKRWN